MKLSLRASALFGAGLATSVSIAVAHANIPKSEPNLAVGTLCECTTEILLPQAPNDGEFIFKTTNIFDTKGIEAQVKCDEYCEAQAALDRKDDTTVTVKKCSAGEGKFTGNYEKGILEYTYQCLGKLELKKKNLQVTYAPPTTAQEACNTLTVPSDLENGYGWDSCTVQ